MRLLAPRACYAIAFCARNNKIGRVGGDDAGWNIGQTKKGQALCLPKRTMDYDFLVLDLNNA